MTGLEMAGRQSSKSEKHSGKPCILLHTVPCKKTRHEILQSDVLAILTTFHIEL